MKSAFKDIYGAGEPWLVPEYPSVDLLTVAIMLTPAIFVFANVIRAKTQRLRSRGELQ